MNRIKYYVIFLLLFSVFFSCTVIDDSSDSILRIWYNNKNIQSNGNTFTIDLLDSGDIFDVKFTLEVEEGAILRDVNNNDLPLDGNNQYATNMDFSSGKKHIFKVTTQDGSINIYTIKVERGGGTQETLSFQKIIGDGIIPNDLANYDEMSKVIFSNYNAGAEVIARYVKETATGVEDGTSWANAQGEIGTLLNRINDADENKIYVVLIASGTYEPVSSYTMKNHIALVGGFVPGNYDRAGETRLDGDGYKRVFNNNDNGLDKTALLYGVVIVNGNTRENGGGMYNKASSPTLINVTFLDNRADSGGGMYNDTSSPTLINVTFSGNEATGKDGGGMDNWKSSPILINVVFLGNKAVHGGGMDFEGQGSTATTLINVAFLSNEANQNGGGMRQLGVSLTLIDVAFLGNTSGIDGGGLYSVSSTSTLIQATFSSNTADNQGGGMYYKNNSSFTLMNVTFLSNTADQGGGMYSSGSISTLIHVTFLGNMADDKGGGIIHDGDGKKLTLINTILWKNNNGNIYMLNDNFGTEAMILYYSLIEGGASASVSATGIRLRNTDSFFIDKRGIVSSDPVLGTFANHGGELNTISIDSGSPAQDAGIYIRGMKENNAYPEANLYYSEDGKVWYGDLGTDQSITLPSDADNLTATDARGYGRVGRPDIGAYEIGGTP